jgi:hypothetical protein
MAKQRKPLPEVRECLKTDCKNDLHCFRQEQKRRPKQKLIGQGCYSCGAELVDWDAVYKRDVDLSKKTFEFMKKEWIRYEFWNKPFDLKALNAAKRIGRKEMPTAIEHRLMTSVGAAKPYKDGGQTKLAGNVLFYAQHATASCCRQCIEYWHGIPAGRELKKAEIAYLRDLMLLYIDERLPNLNKDKQKVSPVRTRKIDKNQHTLQF